MSTNALKTKHNRRGSAAWMLGLLVLVALVAVGLFSWINLQKPATDSGLTMEASGESTQTDPNPSPQLQSIVEEGIATSGRVEVGRLPYREMPRVFDGQGQISGELFPSATEPMPETWTLVIEPSLFAMGREGAVHRELQLSGKQSTFEVRDLPMASYRVFARAEGQASIPQEISLFRIKGPSHRAKDHAHVMLRMQPLSKLHVSLRTKDLSPAIDLPLVLESKGTRKRLQAKTNAIGDCTFDNLPTGLFTLFVGSPDQPLLPAADIQVKAGQASTWEGVLPQTYQVILRVIDAQARPLPGALVRGHGGAPIDGVTDFDGEIVVRYLPKGTYRIRVEHKESESQGRTQFALPQTDAPGDQDKPIVVYCQP